jgi:hypothetical protein
MHEHHCNSNEEEPDSPKEEPTVPQVQAPVAPPVEVKSQRMKNILASAEVIDSLRIVPRIFLLVYGALVYNLYVWFTSITTVVQETCDAAMLKVLLDHGETLEAAQAIVCRVSDITGGPTTEQTAFVTAIVGLSAAVFGFYTNSGKKSSKD